MTKLRKTLAALMLLALIPGLAGCSATASGDVKALFINVRKADAALFFLGDARYLVDTGHKDSHEQLMRVLEAYGIEKLDGVIITHTHKDHAGGLKKMLKAGIQVDRLYGGALHTEKHIEDHPVYEAAEKYDVPVTWLKAGDEIDAGGGHVFHVLGPITHSTVENNNSLVMRLVTPHGDMLLTGDMEEPEEEDLLRAGKITSAPVLKVGNHGEGDATGRKFAMTARPQWAIISTNTDDEPDTPDPDTVSKLKKVGANIAVTQDAEVGILVVLKGGSVADVQQVDWK